MPGCVRFSDIVVVNGIAFSGMEGKVAVVDDTFVLPTGRLRDTSTSDIEEVSEGVAMEREDIKEVANTLVEFAVERLKVIVFSIVILANADASTVTITVGCTTEESVTTCQLDPTAVCVVPLRDNNPGFCFRPETEYMVEFREMAKIVAEFVAVVCGGPSKSEQVGVSLGMYALNLGEGDVATFWSLKELALPRLRL